MCVCCAVYMCVYVYMYISMCVVLCVVCVCVSKYVCVCVCVCVICVCCVCMCVRVHAYACINYGPPLCGRVEVTSRSDRLPSTPLVLTAATCNLTSIPDGRSLHVNTVCDVIMIGIDSPLIT